MLNNSVKNLGGAANLDLSKLFALVVQTTCLASTFSLLVHITRLNVIFFFLIFSYWDASFITEQFMTNLLKLLRRTRTSPSRCCPSAGNSQTDRSSSCCEADGSNQDILSLSPCSCQPANQIFMNNNKPPRSYITERWRKQICSVCWKFFFSAKIIIRVI